MNWRKKSDITKGGGGTKNWSSDWYLWLAWKSGSAALYRNKKGDNGAGDRGNKDDNSEWDDLYLKMMDDDPPVLVAKRTVTLLQHLSNNGLPRKPGPDAHIYLLSSDHFGSSSIK
jgi:hypothetical protein